MTREQIKSQRRREAATKAITALGIPGVTSTRNLEAFLIKCHDAGSRIALCYISESNSLLRVDPFPSEHGGQWQPFPAAPAPASEAETNQREDETR